MSRNPAPNTTNVELHVPDFEQVKDYYWRLGFDVVWEREPAGKKGYLVLELEENLLCFWCGNENVYDHDYFDQFGKDAERGIGTEVIIMVSDIETYYEQVQDKVTVVEELQEQPWGIKDFRVADPFGYYLRFTEPDRLRDPNHSTP